jgi:hypothetical protein
MEPSGPLTVLGQSTLMVHGSADVHISTEIDVGDDDGAAMGRARKLDLELALPVDLSDRTARLSARLHVQPTGSNRSVSSSWEQLAEFKGSH